MSVGIVIAASAAAGLASSVHCGAMCGPLAAFAGRDLRGAASYHGARLGGYAALGALGGATGTLLGDLVSARWAGAITSWTLAVALTLTAWRLWQGHAAPRERLVSLRLERRPSLTARIFARLPKHPAAVGGLTALLPCGALYAAVLLAASSGSALGGAAAMGAFATTSAIGLGVVSVLVARFRTHLARGAPPWMGRAFAALLLVGAVVLVVRPIDALRTEDPVTCGH